MQEQAKYTAYLTQPQRSTIISCNEKPAIDTAILERAFTTACRYDGWELDLLKTVDGFETHGWDAIEISADLTKPGHFYLDHIGADNLYFPVDTKSLQNADFLIRKVEYTVRDIINIALSKGWNMKQVSKMIKASEEKRDKPRDAQTAQSKGFYNLALEKVFYKDHKTGYVMVGWACHKFCDDWLMKPKPLFNGRLDVTIDAFGLKRFSHVYETEYPIVLLPYSVSEEDLIVMLKGRVFYDENKQEAASSLLSAYVTSQRRAASMYWTQDGTGPSIGNIDQLQSDVKLKPNKVFNGNVKQQQLKPADASIMGVINTLIGQSQQESGNLNYAVQSNKSTRKTAEEVKTAKDENAILTNVQVTIFSIGLRKVYKQCFGIYSSRVLAGQIKVQPDVTFLLQNFTYTLKPAGDIDVIERAKKIRLMQESWTVYQETPARNIFLKNLTALLFPDEAHQYLMAFSLDDQKTELLKEVIKTVQVFVSDPVVLERFVSMDNPNQIDPQFAPYIQKLQQIIGMAEQLQQQTAENSINNVAPQAEMPELHNNGNNTNRNPEATFTR